MFNRNSTRNIIKKSLSGYIDKIPLSLNVKRDWIRALHYAIPPVQIFLITFGNKAQFYLGVTVTAIIILLFILLNGCIISSLENALFQDKSNITDIVLEVLKIKKNQQNQVRVTLAIFVLWVIYMIFIYKYRFT